METAVHPKEALRDFIANSARKLGHTVAFWVGTTDPSKLDWVPGEEGVSKARTIHDQINELINIEKMVAAKLRGEATDDLPKADVKSGEEAQAQLIAAVNEAADLVAALPAEKLDEVVDTPFGPRPLIDFLEITLIWNTSYHGGVINAYQMMYGDTEFRFPRG